jgi:Ca2+-binding RTX toxin-like protein
MRNLGAKNHDLVGPADAAAVIAGKANAKTRTYDESTTYFDTEYFGKADRLVFLSGRDNKTPVDNIFFFQLNDREFAGNTKQMTVDATALGGQLNGEGGLYEEFAFVSTDAVTSYTVKFLGGAGGDRFQSGIGGDTLKMGGGDDYVTVGGGDDTVSLGSGNDYVDSTAGDFNAGDILIGGAGIDQLTYYNQSLTDADMAGLRSIEIVASASDGSLELGANAAAAGVRELGIDAFRTQVVTVTAAFTGPSLFINHFGAMRGALTFDASASSVTVTIQAGYDSAAGAPTYIGGSGAEDTVMISNGFIFEGSPPHGGDLSNVTGFEHVVVQDLGGDSGAYLVLDTRAGDIAANFQTVDASGLVAGKAFELRAGAARADLHVVSGAADDLLTSGRGDDRIEGGLGGDTMKSGAGRDVFVYNHVADSSGDVTDAILDFVSGKDKIDVTGLGADLPALSGVSINFVGNRDDDTGLAGTAGNGVLDAVYRTDTHALWFDVNDNGTFDAGDLHIGMGPTTELKGADVLAGHVVI